MTTTQEVSPEAVKRAIDDLVEACVKNNGSIPEGHEILPGFRLAEKSYGESRYVGLSAEKVVREGYNDPSTLILGAKFLVMDQITRYSERSDGDILTVTNGGTEIKYFFDPEGYALLREVPK